MIDIDGTAPHLQSRGVTGVVRVAAKSCLIDGSTNVGNLR